MLEGIALSFGFEKVNKETISFIKYRNKMYSQLLAEDFERVGIDPLGG